ncbi:filamentous hemagglutinin N-terminal domain-containing protein [Campylobacter lari]|uniref:Filamentous hemagglutinin N-terminal domain-containing protein n=1 Tax=Campylobacter lari TaxID=201 RepID=A0A7M1MID7_CAMLA|nr:filamentous hemagglutinin N-terminal domain-containing protein [Campylobacter lari]
MKKLANHIILSGVTVSMLLSPMVAADKPLNPNQLPSGGKFTHGTSGSININGNNMYINGNQQNSVIQWGGGFSIGKDAQVHFGKGQSGQNYLNIAHGTSKSTIEGILNAGGNNVFLINPNGVIITKTGTINANRFVASTSSMDNKSMQEFADGKYTNGKVIDYTTFSPIFKPQKAGNVVNMGTINAQNITLQGNKVVLDTDTSWDDKMKNQTGIISANEINLQGNEVYVDVGNINGDQLKSLKIQGSNGNNFKGSMYLNASGYYYNPNSFKVFDKYTNTNNNFKVYKYVGIGSDVDWWHFAKGWNENKEGFRDTASEYRLTNDIDFKASSGQNYANYCIEGYGCTNMIVGYKSHVYNENWEIIVDNSFSNKTFDGQGFALKNINIDTTNLEYIPEYVGIFGNSNNSEFKNIKIDYNNNSIKSNSIFTGGFIGYASDGSSFKNIELSNIASISTQTNDVLYTGGFVGYVSGANFNKININNINELSGVSVDNRSHIGGFAGSVNNGKFENIYLSQINKIINNKTTKETYTGGFAGEIWEGFFENIDIRGIKEISGGFVTGGFSGNIDYAQLSNINLDISNITSTFSTLRHTYAGGFVGSIDSGNNKFSNINIRVKKIKSINNDNNGLLSGEVDDVGNAYAGGFAGFANGGIFNNISLEAEKIEAINNNNLENTRAVVGGFIGKVEGYRSDNLSFSNITVKNIDAIVGKLEQDKKGIVNSGGFIGWIQRQGTGDFSNISLYNIKNIQAYGKNDFANAGGFIGYIESGSIFNSINLNFNNIYLFFENGSQIQSFTSDGKNTSGKFISAFDNKQVNLKFNNIHLYHYINDFSGVNSDINLWKNAINVYIYNDGDKYIKYNDFLNKDSMIVRPIVKLPEKPEFSSVDINLPNVDSIIKEEVALDKDDLYEDTIKDEILADITNQHYKIYINTLLEMLAEKNYSEMTLDEKVAFISKYFIKDTSNSKKEALKIVESIDFIVAYQTNGLNNADSDKFKNGVQSFYINNIKINIDKIIEKGKSISEILNNELKDFVVNSEQLIKELGEIQNQLKSAENDYNEYVKNNNQIDISVLNSLLSKIVLLEKQQDSILSQLDLSPIKNKIEYQNKLGSFLVIGDYKLSPYKPVLDIPNTDNEIDFVHYNVKSFGLIGDEFIKKDSKIDVIGEAETDGYKKTCVSSFNSKVMNTCIN